MQAVAPTNRPLERAPADTCRLVHGRHRGWCRHPAHALRRCRARKHDAARRRRPDPGGGRQPADPAGTRARRRERAGRDAGLGRVVFADRPYGRLGRDEHRDTHVAYFPLGPGFEVQYAINPASTLLTVNRRDGVTSAVVASAAGNDPLSGCGAAIHLGDGNVLTHPRLALFGSIGWQSADFVGGSRSAVIQR
jgi:hypothetical protein